MGGAQSAEMLLKNMVYQGTVLGTILWNQFFEDARFAISEYHFTEVVYADDLNAFRIFGASESTYVIQKSTDLCQPKLHAWGRQPDGVGCG